MESITVRRWVDGAPARVARRVLDLDRLVERHDAVALDGPVGALRGASTTVALLTAGERWLLTISVDAIPGATGSGSDVRLHAERDPAHRRRAPVTGANRHRRAARHLRRLLDEFIADLATADAALPTDPDLSAAGDVGGSRREPQRIAPGR